MLYLMCCETVDYTCGACFIVEFSSSYRFSLLMRYTSIASQTTLGSTFSISELELIASFSHSCSLSTRNSHTRSPLSIFSLSSTCCSTYSQKASSSFEPTWKSNLYQRSLTSGLS